MGSELVRPDPFRWLWYAVGGRLPGRYRDWVLHDTTTRTWIWRHAARSSVLLVPLCSVWLLLPGPLGLRLPLVLLAALVGYFYSFAYIEESIEHRLAKNGYPRGTGKRVRAEAKAELEKDVLQRYVARYRQ
ncbi:DUF5313 family protein [Amycolatopsis palatopharyngis]|uniref:DUF5313 family protein n=1 Tax=Amycolatopsis palatopharyngis TaxID=187982 RepID=UPI000E26E42E|nr:DUF5313 family protein [Amycolatopsis palatopharyngis]